MVKLALYLTATLDGVTSLQPQFDPASPEEYYFSFQVQCSSCRETHPNYVSISRHETSDMSGSRGEANFVWKCKSCGRESSAQLDPVIHPYTESGSKQLLFTMETRGCEFISFRATDSWTCVGLSEGKKRAAVFKDVDLGDGEWYDYDDVAGTEVSIIDVEWSVSRA